LPRVTSLTRVVAISALTAAGFASCPVLAPDAVGAQAVPACSDGTLVTTENGPVCGVVSDGVAAYLGVPYAAPPVGDLRWRPPAPVKPWTTTLQATQVGLNCPQPSFPPGSTSSAVRSEDCLTLNLYVPQG